MAMPTVRMATTTEVRQPAVKNAPKGAFFVRGQAQNRLGRAAACAPCKGEGGKAATGVRLYLATTRTISRHLLE